MQLVRLDSLAPRGLGEPAVTVGNFDGVHRGHQALVAAVRAEAAAARGLAVALTFEPHPARVLSPARAPASLMTLEQKAETLAALGMDALAILPFTRELARKTPEEFAREVLKQCLGAGRVAVGANFRFGRGRAGDLEELTRLGALLGFRVVGVPPVLHEGAPVSSTRVREALAGGAVEAVVPLLGRPFYVDGRVVAGVGRGRTLGIPTVNLEVTNETLPLEGVYAGRVRVGPGPGEDWPAVVNLGRRPTFGGGATTLEAHLLDYDGDLYGRTLRLAFVARLRGEQVFSGPDALLAQIRRDIERARAVLLTPSPDAV